MRTNWIVKGFALAIFALIIVAGFGQAVLQLWNWLMPDIFGLHRISFWQAVGLMFLSWLLFGGLGLFRGRPVRGIHWRRRMSERWEQMTPEERDKFRQGLKSRCGQVESQTAEPRG